MEFGLCNVLVLLRVGPMFGSESLCERFGSAILILLSHLAFFARFHHGRRSRESLGDHLRDSAGPGGDEGEV